MSILIPNFVRDLIDFMSLYCYIYRKQTEGESKMKKVTIEISEDHCFFLKEKALELQKQNKNASIISIIRDLIERDDMKD
mgnify:CR=1 FL=1